MDSHPNRNLYLPTLKSNMANHPVFYNNTMFISNTKAFYDDLDYKLQENDCILMDVIDKSLSKINKYNNEVKQKSINNSQFVQSDNLNN